MRGIAVLMLALLSGCAHVQVASDASSARPLLAPTLLGSERSATQVVRGAFGPREVSINCVVTVRDRLLTIVGLTALGVRAFTIRYDGQEVKVDNDLPVPAQLTPERLLADVELVYWPFKSLRASLSKVGLELTEPFSGTRRLRRNDRLIAEVHYENTADPWQGRSWLVNLEYGYSLSIDSTPVAQP